jgi:hypothetical protein
LDFDIDFLVTNGYVTVARLNAFSKELKLSPRDFALTLLFDGTTTAREAYQFVLGSRRGGKARSGIVDNLVSQIHRAGFSVSPNGKQTKVT